MKCDRITERVFVGPDLREAADFRQLQELGVTAVLSLQTEDDLRNRAVDWEGRSAAGFGMAYSNLPVTDFDLADLALRLPSCVDTLEELLREGHTVYVHCTAGVIRSPTVVAAYLHRCEGWQLEAAVAHLEKTRHCNPNQLAIRLAFGVKDRSDGS